jgi:hypothetical protein
VSDWQFVGLVAVVGAFCVVRGAVDLRARRYVWGGIGVVIGLAALLTPVPVQTQAVKIDLPANR